MFLTTTLFSRNLPPSARPSAILSSRDLSLEQIKIVERCVATVIFDQGHLLFNFPADMVALCLWPSQALFLEKQGFSSAELRLAGQHFVTRLKRLGTALASIHPTPQAKFSDPERKEVLQPSSSLSTAAYPLQPHPIPPLEEWLLGSAN